MSSSIFDSVGFEVVKDLKDMGQDRIIVSDPIVPFLETIMPDLLNSNAKILIDHLTVCNYFISNGMFRNVICETMGLRLS